MQPSTQVTTDDAECRAFEAIGSTEVHLPIDAHVIGEPVTVTRIRYDGLPRLGLRATCQRGEHTYDVCLADIVFPPGGAGARLVAQYRAWLGFSDDADGVLSLGRLRPHKVEDADIVVGVPVDLIVLACKSNALRCRLLGTTREVTMRTAVRDEIPGSIISVTPRKQWTHARHPYLSGNVLAVRIDATALGLVPLSLSRKREWDADGDRGGGAPSEHSAFEMERISPRSPDSDADLIFEATERIDAGDYSEAEELLTRVLALDLRCLEAHALLGDRALRHFPVLALRHYELGTAIGSLTIGDDFDGVLPWGLFDNRPFLLCLQGMARAHHRCGRGDAAADALRRLLRLDPADPLSARASLAAMEAGGSWRETEEEP